LAFLLFRLWWLRGDHGSSQDARRERGAAVEPARGVPADGCETVVGEHIDRAVAYATRAMEHFRDLGDEPREVYACNNALYYKVCRGQELVRQGAAREASTEQMEGFRRRLANA